MKERKKGRKMNRKKREKEKREKVRYEAIERKRERQRTVVHEDGKCARGKYRWGLHVSERGGCSS